MTVKVYDVLEGKKGPFGGILGHRRPQPAPPVNR